MHPEVRDNSSIANMFPSIVKSGKCKDYRSLIPNELLY